MLEPLRHRVYARLFAAQVVALTGTGLATVALGLLAFDLAGGRAGAVLGTALFIKMVAYVGLAPFAGALAERLPRRALLVGLNLIRAGVALMLPFVESVWQIYALIFLLQAAAAFYTPAFQAVIPEILTDEAEYTRALSLSRMAYDLESLGSPRWRRRRCWCCRPAVCSRARRWASSRRRRWSRRSACRRSRRPARRSWPAPRGGCGSIWPRRGCAGCWR